MALLVQKYGGSSLASPARLSGVAAHIARSRAAGDDLVVVVSAMGDTTDELLELACAVAASPRRKHPRELDMLLTAGERISMALLAMAVREAGQDAVSLTGSQAAIITDGSHTIARIEEIGGGRVRDELGRGRIVIVAGFQGVSRGREITTLGRGGSDTTAIALAAALAAQRCEIFTDVDGVFTADPRMVPEARRIPVIDYEEMLELAQSGAKVLHVRAVEIAARFDMPIHVRSSFTLESDHPGGTQVRKREHGMEELMVAGLASESGHARIVLRGLAAEMRTMARVLGALADAGISVDLVTQADGSDGTRQLQLTLHEEDLPDARRLCEDLIREVHGAAIDVQTDLSRIRLVGSGMHGRPGVYARAFDALLAESVPVHALSTSSISITLLVDTELEATALRALHAAFELQGTKP